MTEHNGEQAGFGGGEASSEEHKVQASADQAQPQHSAASPVTPDPAASNPTESIPTPNPTLPIREWQDQRHPSAGGPTPVVGPAQPGQPGPQYPAQQQGQQYPGQHGYGQALGHAQGQNQGQNPNQYQGPTQPLAQQYQGQPQAGAPHYGAHSQSQPQTGVPQYGAPSQSQQAGTPQSEPRYGQYAQTGYGTPIPPSDAGGQAGPQPARRREKKKVGAGIFVAGMVAAALVGGGAAGRHHGPARRFHPIQHRAERSRSRSADRQQQGQCQCRDGGGTEGLTQRGDHLRHLRQLRRHRLRHHPRYRGPHPDQHPRGDPGRAGGQRHHRGPDQRRQGLCRQGGRHGSAVRPGRDQDRRAQDWSRPPWAIPARSTSATRSLPSALRWGSAAPSPTASSPP